MASGMQSSLSGEGGEDMDISRRTLLHIPAALSVRPAVAAKTETYRFRTDDADIEMSIRFHDRYSSRGFWFREQMSNSDYCLSPDGEQGAGCLAGFRGSLAIARYRVRPRIRNRAVPMLREYVRTIDHDARLSRRPPFERTIKLINGIGSDLQAFGYEVAPGEEPISEMHGPWCLYRQDLFLEPERTAFLVVLWKHALSSIRLLDMIPGDQTWVVKK